ncbi:MAG: hypothetical protein AB1505_16845 [Candidatus Latescibacterota bacterium]
MGGARPPGVPPPAPRAPTLACLGLLLLVGGQAWAQVSPSPVGRTFLAERPLYPQFELEMVRPELHEWYLPRHLPESDDIPWYIVDTRYAREQYRRYVDAALEGDLFYDPFGQPLERGWLLYQWSQEQEHAEGSAIWKSTHYRRLFQDLVIASDGGGGGDFRLMVGDEIHTVFTPLTFNKPRFNGMRLDWATDRLRTSLILSRPSWANEDLVVGSVLPSERKDFTNLVGGRLDWQPGGPASFGLTYVNVHHGQTKEEFGAGSPFHGSLTTQQARALGTLWVRLRDDSPADGGGGALLFDYDIVLVDTSGTRVRGRQIGFLPAVEGGRARGSSLAADGSETILLTWDLGALEALGRHSADLRQATVELFVANDYRVEAASNLQAGGEVRRPVPVFLTYARAAGNVTDNSNATVLRVDYGLPTATEVAGLNATLVEWGGLSLLGEAALSRQHRIYPSPTLHQRHHSAAQGLAGYLQAAYVHHPFTLFGEAFSIADEYTTRAWLVGGDGRVLYDDPTQGLYELVDDDDDFNALPEWQRRGQASAEVAWPGFDENRDFVYDYNQNQNLVPDYEEPFLRFRADRPELLPGLDMNYNGTVDRFENDEYPDYPYRGDHRGYNAYASLQATPNLGLTAGYQRMHLVSGDGRTHAAYGLVRWSRMVRGTIRVRFHDRGARVQDDIPDPLRLWSQPVGVAGQMRDVEDPLPARNAWTNALYADLEHRVGPGVRLQHRLQRTDFWQRRGRQEGRDHSGFLGLVDRAEWSLPVGLATFEPRWKSEYRHLRPFALGEPQTRSLEEILILLWTQPLLAESSRVAYFPRYGRQVFSTEVQLGVERSYLYLLDGRHPGVAGDYSGWSAILQLTNRNAYQGYRMVTRVGLQLDRRHFAGARDERRNVFFVTLNAGLD